MTEKCPEFVTQTAKDIGMKEENALLLFNKILVRHQKMSGTDEEKMERAKSEFEARLRKYSFLGKSKDFEGIILACESPRDLLSKVRRISIEHYTTDKTKAIAEGFCNSEGVPLDWRREYSTGTTNPAYGKPVDKPRWMKRIIGIGTFSEQKNVLPFVMSVSGDQALEEIKCGIFTRFRAIDRTPTESKIYLINQSAATVFNYDENEKTPPLKTLIEGKCANLIIPFSQIPKWFEKNKGDWNSFFITQADVVSIAPTVSSVGNRIVEFDDLENVEELSNLRAWVPEDLINFGIASRLYLVANATTMPSLFQEGDSELMLNVLGVIPINIITPEEISEVKEEDLEAEVKEKPKTEKTKTEGVIIERKEKKEGEVGGEGW